MSGRTLTVKSDMKIPVGVSSYMDARRGVSKGVKDGRRPATLRQATPEMAVRQYQGWPAHRA
jgi:hypothetical protein